MADENKPAKYIRYALGEITLVVIGILIALQINNWNQSRLEQKQESKILQTLLRDLNVARDESIRLIKKDQINFDGLEFFLSGEEARETLINHPKVDSLFNPLIWGSVNTEIPVINSYTDLKNAGKTGLISNENIRIHFSALENKFHILNKILQDRLSVQLINIDKFVINQINFIQLLKEDAHTYKVDYGAVNDYAALFKNQFVLNAIGVKLELTNSVLHDRKMLLKEIEALIDLIETELGASNPDEPEVL